MLQQQQMDGDKMGDYDQQYGASEGMHQMSYQ